MRSALTSFVLATFALVAQTAEEYVGQYVFKVGGRNFIVLAVEHRNGRWIGTFSRPKHAEFGFSYSRISNQSLTEHIVSGTFQNGQLHLVAAHTEESSELEGLDLKLLESGVELKFSDAPLGPLHLMRAPSAPPQAVGSGWDANCTYYPDDLTQSNPEMRRIFADDQKYRHSWAEFKAHEELLTRQDKLRRQEVRKLLDNGDLHSARDFAEAAFIFQHGSTSDDYLLAHTLATIAVMLGDRSSAWIASATLDRYLQVIGQPQIYGTQMQPNALDSPKEPYNRALVPDNVRRKLGLSDPEK